VTAAAKGDRPAARRGLPRWADIVLAAVGLVLSSPILLVAAIAIKLDSRGPVFYRQQRVGLDGAMFELWKLRTMTHGAPLGGIWDPLTKDDPRVTRAGALLRRTSLDELPNLPRDSAGASR
jgi:putative colanic acid biosysnthesis UDP-glucose lipid carrier transferase